MFPIRDHNPSERTPYVTIGLIFLNIVIFILTEGWSPQPGGWWEVGALYPVAVLDGQNVWGLVTHMFLHAGIMHLIGNMLFLWIFGDNLEDQMGHLPFLGFYLASGLAAAAAQMAADPTSGIPMVGASGAIAGVMGGYLLFFPRARVDVLFIIVIVLKIFPIPAWIVLGVWFAIQTFSGVMLAGGEGGVAYWAHAGGFAAGLLLALPFWLRRGAGGFWQATRGQPPHPEVDYRPTRIPSVRR
ncbi:rhomboid family intramembrane serine protease [Paracoccus sp. p4-l81]|uniref:rhomboid family intramembrane serine protease n=1 Tax=unclassified Paracoccus (in: a-proteobacteria) TaxID=2688777 RepID=UPI0035B9B2A3